MLALREKLCKMKFSMIIISIIAALSIQVQAMTIRDRTSELNVDVINPSIIEPMNKASFKARIRNSLVTNQNCIFGTLLWPILLIFVNSKWKMALKTASKCTKLRFKLMMKNRNRPRLFRLISKLSLQCWNSAAESFRKLLRYLWVIVDFCIYVHFKNQVILSDLNCHILCFFDHLTKNFAFLVW